MRKKDILQFVTTQMDLEAIMLNDLSHTEKHKYCMSSFTRKILKKAPQPQKQTIKKWLLEPREWEKQEGLVK